MESVELECGDISASQEELLARSSFLNGGDDDEVFSTPPTTQEDAITMCTLPFTQSPAPSPSPAPAPEPEPAATPRTIPVCSSSSEDGGQDDEMGDAVKQRRRLGVCKRKVRGARIRTPTPSPNRAAAEVEEHRNDDPLHKAVLMIPTRDCTPGIIPVDLLALARQRGLF
ncbi:uncharacterized protein LOC102721432 [Oryza brachyantha]|uniref:Uncharacterized protein n=1 Tax=Oryza brachyantha TaxID=4533 RepID=J3LLD3_ORYBR|nr:uncharacterized protein LOC102721432 [Oryza brachyantha]